MNFRDVARRHRHKVLPVVLLAAAAVSATIYRDSLRAWFTGQPLGSEGGAATVASAGALGIEATLSPDPPRQQGNTLRLQVRDPDGGPVEGASVSVGTSMPAMGAMPEMRGAATLEERGGGRYDARFDLQMGGSWTVEVRIDSPRGSATVRYTLTVGSAGLTTVGSEGGPPPSSQPTRPPSHAFADPARARVREAFDAYEAARAILAADAIEGLDGRAASVRDALRAAVEEFSDAPPDVRSTLAAAGDAANQLGRATEIADARRRFGDLSERLVRLTEIDPRLAEGWHVFRCPMAEGFQKWFQRAADIENPYMGQQMLTCGSASEWTTVEAPASQPHEGHEHGDGEIAYYTCSMHPSVKQETPGTCPICNMDLTPVTREELETGVLLVDAVRRQRLGVRTAPVERRRLTRSIRAVGRVAYDETRIHDVNMRVDGWIDGLRVDETGQEVRRGATLFTVYSPELFSAQQELILAERGGGSLAQAARQRLRLWGLTGSQIDEVVRRGEPRESIAIRAPASGFVIEKHVFDGAHVGAGQLLYRIAALDRVWVEADIYEQDLPHVRVGQAVTVTLPYLPESAFEGEVAYVYPYLAGSTRTGKVRVELANPDGALRPDMYADVELQVDLGEHLAVPAEAVIYTGPRRLVFVDLGEGRLRPQEIEVGARAGQWFEVRTGLAEGDVAVVSGNFLVAAESRIRSAAEFWGATDDTH